MTILSRPPESWKRPAMPKGVKAAVFVRQGGKCAESGVKLGSIGGVPFEYDHRPGLWERKFDTEARNGKGDTIPASNDPEFIQAIAVTAHKARSAIDTGRRSKEDRITGRTKTRDKSARFAPPPRGVEVLRPAEPEKKPGRSYTWPKRGLKSRNTLRRRPHSEVTTGESQ